MQKQALTERTLRSALPAITLPEESSRSRSLEISSVESLQPLYLLLRKLKLDSPALEIDSLTLTHLSGHDGKMVNKILGEVGGVLRDLELDIFTGSCLEEAEGLFGTINLEQSTNLHSLCLPGYREISWDPLLLLRGFHGVPKLLSTVISSHLSNIIFRLYGYRGGSLGSLEHIDEILNRPRFNGVRNVTFEFIGSPEDYRDFSAVKKKMYRCFEKGIMTVSVIHAGAD